MLARCEKASEPSGLYGIRVEERSDAWYATWGFALNQRRATRERYGDTVVRSSLLLADGFPGCPHCEAASFVQCGTCQRLTCWDGAVRVWHCRWTPCRGSGVPGGAIERFGRHGDV
ncbi:hypothetical protein GCM10009557_07290 [Virgisporangium ochraceum]|uniref:Uncharacterized protein n=1 Tax=Virgisporangium ochraceum TaxID=65505 RepID=A0A8J4A2G9_9ACTN|nr:hypothetical protein Voc01_094410 [Virgisporangium ochraceum]